MLGQIDIKVAKEAIDNIDKALSYIEEIKPIEKKLYNIGFELIIDLKSIK